MSNEKTLVGTLETPPENIVVYAIIDRASLLVINIVQWDKTRVWDGDSDATFGVESSTAQIGWSYVNGVFSAPPPTPPTDQELSASNTAQLQQLNQLAQAQKTALTNRVGTLQDAIDLEMATPAEVAELPVRQAQLTEWKRYAVYLGRVTTQAGWALTVDWPVQPSAGIDLSTSAAVASVAQTS